MLNEGKIADKKSRAVFRYNFTASACAKQQLAKDSITANKDRNELTSADINMPSSHLTTKHIKGTPMNSLVFGGDY